MRTKKELIKIGILFGVIALTLFSVFHSALGVRINLPVWLAANVQNFLQENPELSIEPYRNGTIILVKPIATGVGEGRYEAGDIVEIRDGEEIYKRFGDKPFLGKEEQAKLLPVYYPGKLTEEEKQILMEPEFENSKFEARNPKQSAPGGQNSNDENPKPDKQKLVMRRKVGVDYTKILSESEILKIRSEKKLDRIPEIDLSAVIDKKSGLSLNKKPAKMTDFLGFRDNPMIPELPPSFSLMIQNNLSSISVDKPEVNFLRPWTRGELHPGNPRWQSGISDYPGPTALSLYQKNQSDANLISVVQLSKNLARIEKTANAFQKLARKIIPFAYAGTGGTKTICTSGCDYTTLNTWEAGEQGILASPAIAQITEGFQDTAAVTIDGWTTTAANYIKIYTTAAARHDGKWNASKYRLSAAPAADGVIYILEDNVIVEGLQINHTGTVDATYGLVYYLVGNIQISHNIILYTGGGANLYRGITGDSLGIIKIWNNIIYDFSSTGSAGIRLGGGSTGTHYLYNNTIHNSLTGISQGAGTTIAKNNLMKSCTAAASGTFAAGTDYNATNNAAMGYTVTGGGNTHDRLSQTFSFVNEDGDDFHLASNDAGAKDQWGNVYADANLAVTTDIDADARPNGLLGDIGADECHLTPSPGSGTETPKTRIKGNVRIKGGVEFK